MEKEEAEKWADNVLKEMNTVAELEFIRHNGFESLINKSDWTNGFIRGCIFIQQINKLNNLKLNKNE